jgi:hypothetical protein
MVLVVSASQLLKEGGRIEARKFQNYLTEYHRLNNQFPESFNQAKIGLFYNTKKFRYKGEKNDYKLSFIYFNYIYLDYYLVTPNKIYEKHYPWGQWKEIK